MRNSKVFILNEYRHKFGEGNLSEFGEVIFLFSEALNPAMQTQDLIVDITEALKDEEYDPQIDYVVLMGHAIELSLFLAIVASIANHRVRTIIYDPHLAKYVERRLTFESGDQTFAGVPRNSEQSANGGLLDSVPIDGSREEE